MRRRSPPDILILKSKYRYDRHTGIFTYKNQEKKRFPGFKRRDGYMSMSVGGRSFLAHHLAWFYCYGTWPEEIDHKDRNRSNNKINNLRDASRSQNNGNSNGWGIKKKSGLPRGVYRSSQRKKNPFRAQIVTNHKIVHLGCFDSIEKAKEAYDEAAKVHFGEFFDG